MSDEQSGVGVDDREEQQQPELNQEQQFPQQDHYNQGPMQGDEMGYANLQDNQQYGYYDDDDADRRSPPVDHSESGQGGESNSLGKIFVGGVSWQTNELSLRNHFEKFGELDDVALMTDKRTGQPRGFGFVTFRDASAVDVVLQQEHVIDGRTVDVKRAVPKDEAPAPTRLESKKVFVGGLAPTVTETEFREYFEAYGPVKEAIVMYDRQTNRSRGFGFITFDTEEAVNKIMKDKQHEIMGKFVEVKRAEPRDARSSGGGDRGDRGGGGGDRDDMYGGMGMYGNRYPGMYAAPMRYPYGYGGRGGGGPPAGGQYPGFGGMGYYGGFPPAYGMGPGGYGGAAGGGGGGRSMYGYGGGRGGGGGGREGSQERGAGPREPRDDRGGRSSQSSAGPSDRSGPPQSGYRGMMGMMPMGYGYGYGYGMGYGGPRPSSGQPYSEYGGVRGQGAQQNRAERSFRPY